MSSVQLSYNEETVNEAFGWIDRSNGDFKKFVKGNSALAVFLHHLSQADPEAQNNALYSGSRKLVSVQKELKEKARLAEFEKQHTAWSDTVAGLQNRLDNWDITKKARVAEIMAQGDTEEMLSYFAKDEADKDLIKQELSNLLNNEPKLNQRNYKPIVKFTEQDFLDKKIAFKHSGRDGVIAGIIESDGNGFKVRKINVRVELHQHTNSDGQIYATAENVEVTDAIARNVTWEFKRIATPQALVNAAIKSLGQGGVINTNWESYGLVQ